MIADHERKARYWKAALAHVDATLRLFSDEIDPNEIPPKRVYRQSRYFHGAELARHATRMRRQSARRRRFCGFAGLKWREAQIIRIFPFRSGGLRLFSTIKLAGTLLP